MSDLDAEIKLLQATVDRTPSVHPERIERLHRLGLGYHKRYQEIGNTADLDRAIDWYQASIDQTLSDHLEYADRLHDLGAGYLVRYRRTVNTIDQDMIIKCFQASVDQTLPDHSEYAERLEILATGYSDRHRRTDSVSDLDEAIKYSQVLVDYTPLDHLKRAARLQNLGARLSIRHRRTGNISDLDTAIKCFQELLDHTSPDHPQRAARFHILATTYGDRYRKTGNASDLDTVIKHLQASLDHTPLDHPDRIRRLYDLGVGYVDRHRKTGDISDLDTAIKYFQESLDHTSPDHPDRVKLIHGLGAGYIDRHSRLGNASDLDTAIKHLQASLDHTPLDHPERAARLEVLGGGYNDRHRTTGNPSDLDIAIKHSQASVKQTPLDHPDRTRRLQNLGARYYDRYRWTGNTADLDTAIQSSEMSLNHTPLDHPERAARLHSLGSGYATRYLGTGNVNDIDAAIKHFHASLDQGHIPLDHPDRADRLRDLGAAYNDRYLRTRNVSDLDTAIKYFQVSLDHAPLDYVNRAGPLQGLGIGYYKRYQMAGSTSDLDTAIKHLQASLDHTPLGRPERADRLRDLGVAYNDRYRRTGNTADLEMAIKWLEEATSVPSFPVRHRLGAAMELLPIYTETDRLKEAYDVAHKAMQVVPLLTPRFLNNADKQSLLASVAGLASDSAAIVLFVAKDVFDAVQFLELGRGVISGSLTEMRTDVTALSSSHPELGQEFIRLRNLLDSPRISYTSDTLPSSSSSRSDLRYDAQEKMEKLLSNIRNKHGFGGFLLPLKREDMQKAAAFGAIVIVNVSQYRCDAICVEQHGIRSIPLPKLSSRDIKKKAQEHDFGSSGTLCWMWDTIANPVLEALGLTHAPSDGKWPRIWWIPTGLLTKFPLHAAGSHQGNCSETVLDRVMSSYSSSIKAIIHRRAIRPSEALRTTSSQALLVAVPNAPGSNSLPCAMEEVAAVRRVCESMMVKPVEPGRRKSGVVSHLAQCKIFHFAGHGHTDASDPSRSYLLLEDWKSDPLTVANLLEMSVQDHLPFLAYLSACGTGQIRHERLLDESIHLISAFQLAGFRHVIGTLWEVRDDVCVEIARTTYEGIRDGHMTDESVCLGLHNASRKLRDIWLSAKTLKSRQQSRVRNAGHRDHGQVQSARDVVLYDSEDEEEGSLSWVPYVHYGV